MVTISTEDVEICLLRSSTVKSQTNALTWDSLKSLCICKKQNNTFSQIDLLKVNF